MWRVVNRSMLFGGIALSAILIILPTVEGLSRPGQNCLAVFCFSITMWITQFLPLPVTGFLVFALLPILGILPSSQAFSLLGSNAVFFILGAFVIAAAMMSSGLSKRLALLFVSRFDKSPSRLLAGVLISSAALALLMPEHVVAAMMFPIVLELAQCLRLTPRQSNYGKALFLSLAYGAVIGGVGTFLGGARNPLAVGMLKDSYGIEINFLQWIVAAGPFVIVMLVLAFLMLKLLFKIEFISVKEAHRVLRADIKRLGPLSLREKKIASIFTLAILSWIFFSNQLGLATIAILASGALFVTKTINWKDIENNINWGIILMYGGAIAIGVALSVTKASDWLALRLIAPFSGGHFSLIAALSLASKLLTEGISNVAAVAILLPISFGFVDVSGLSPVVMLYAITIPAGLAFALPIGTPPNAIAFSSGYYSISDSIKGGIILNALSWLLVLAVAKFYWPLLRIM
jgi:sodium-dependent dicarboxylate transporter 2/3/5